MASLDDDFFGSGDDTSEAGAAQVAPFRAEDDRFAAEVWNAFAHSDPATDLDVRAFVGRVRTEATPECAFGIASVLFGGGACHEAYAVFVYGLSLESADVLTTEGVVELLPLAVLEGLAAEAEARGELDIAGFLEAVAVVSAGL